MINFSAKRQKFVASLFCLSFSFVIAVSCGAAPVISLARIVSAAETVVTLMDLSEKTLYVVSSLVNTSYETLGEDIKSENFRANNRFSNDIIEKMETRHSELVAKHKELDDSLDKTNVAANDLFSLLETRANQNSRESLREEQIQDISAKKEVFSKKIEVAESFSSKLEASIKDYDNILNVFQVNVGLNEAQKYIETVDSVISQYELLEQEVQVAVREGRQIIANVAGIPSQSLEATVPATIPQSPEAIIPSPTPESSAIQQPSLPLQKSPLSPSSIDSVQPDTLPFFMVRLVDETDLQGKSMWELDIMRNEIYARYGRRFKNADLQKYFNSQSWYVQKYSPDEFPNSLLTPIQRENAKFILEYRNKG